MDKIIMILEDIDDSIDYSKEMKLVDDHLLDSFGIISLVGELEEEFDISIDASEMIPENFNSAEALWEMVQRLM
ncbi:MAG: acyl carrier protein [Lachnospiraceae bacterium]|nr:acyl carrier protein [Lachnospiraceae bacterium]